jgi:hypothetical protein
MTERRIAPVETAFPRFLITVRHEDSDATHPKPDESPATSAHSMVRF